MRCPHRCQSEGCCRLGRFGGHPSMGVCATACDIGVKCEWPELAGAPEAPPGTTLEPCDGCGEGNEMKGGTP